LAGMLLAKFIEKDQEIKGSFFIHTLAPTFFLSGMEKKYRYLAFVEVPDYIMVRGGIRESNWTDDDGERHFFVVSSARYGKHRPNKIINIYNLIDKIKKESPQNWKFVYDEVVEIVVNDNIKVIDVYDLGELGYSPRLLEGKLIEEIKKVLDKTKNM